MEVIKINALWCSACIIMNKRWNNVNKKYNIETFSLDYDFDNEEVSKYNPGKILPVFIFIKDNQEVQRITGEKKEQELIEIIEQIGV